MPDIPTHKAESPRNDGFMQAGKDALLYSLVQAPIDSINQIAKHTINTELTDLHIVDAPKEQAEGSSGAYGQMLGGVVGTLPYFYALSRVGGATAAELTGVGTAESLSLRARMASAGASGFAYDALFHPVSAAEEKNFWRSKGINAISSGLTFAAMDGVAIGANKFISFSSDSSHFLSGTQPSATFARASLSSGIAGLAGGLVATESHSLLSGKGLTTENLGENMATFAILGMGSAAVDAALAAHTRGVTGERPSKAVDPPPSDIPKPGESLRGPVPDAGRVGLLDSASSTGGVIKFNSGGDIYYDNGITTIKFDGASEPYIMRMNSHDWNNARIEAGRTLPGEGGDITKLGMEFWTERTVSLRDRDGTLFFGDGLRNRLVLRPDGTKTFYRANGEQATYRMNAEDVNARQNFETQSFMNGWKPEREWKPTREFKPTSDQEIAWRQLADGKESIRMPEINPLEDFVQLGESREWIGSRGTLIRKKPDGAYDALREDGAAILGNGLGDGIIFKDGMATQVRQGKQAESKPMDASDWTHQRRISRRPLPGEEGDITQRGFNWWKERTLGGRYPDGSTVFKDFIGNAVSFKPDGTKTFTRANGERATYRTTAEDYAALKDFHSKNKDFYGKSSAAEANKNA